MTEETGTPLRKIPAPTTADVILIPPLGLEQTAKWAEALKAWWAKHGDNIIKAAKDAASMVPPLLLPQPPAPTIPPPTTPAP
jgi:hypothetical protein